MDPVLTAKESVVVELLQIVVGFAEAVPAIAAGETMIASEDGELVPQLLVAETVIFPEVAFAE